MIVKMMDVEMELWKKFNDKVLELYRHTNGKKVIIWGYGYVGSFVEHLFKRSNKSIDIIIEDNPQIKVKRRYILETLNKEECFIILTMAKDIEVEEYLSQLNFQENADYIYVRELFFPEDAEKKVSYYDYLEYYYGLDLTTGKVIDKEAANKGNKSYSTGPDYSLVDVLDKFVFDDKDAVFDFGCGKGASLINFFYHGVKKIGGVEYDKELYLILKDNFEKLKLDYSNVIRGDARDVTDKLDEYNYFYMYNPFGGELFSRVIKNLEDSYLRNKRRMTLIYSGACLHSKVIEGGFFILTKTVETDFWLRDVHIYTTYV